MSLLVFLLGVPAFCICSEKCLFKKAGDRTFFKEKAKFDGRSIKRAFDFEP